MASATSRSAAPDLVGELANLASVPANLAAQRIVPCFPAGTLVLTPEGHTAIEDLKPGDLVMSRPEDNNGTAVPTPQVVEEVFTREGQLFEVEIAGRLLRTTPEHPFFVQGQGWTAAGELQPGQLLSTESGEWLPVESVIDTGQTATVYNFRVADFHTYFVGGEDWTFSVWVHNAYNGQKRALGDFTSELSLSGDVARARLRASLGLRRGDSLEAHHLIPLGLTDHELVKKAARSGFNFNGNVNGIALSFDRHRGVNIFHHNKYNAAVEKKLNRLIGANPGVSDEGAAALLRGYAEQLNAAISRTTGRLQ